MIQIDVGAAVGDTDMQEVYSFPQHATVVPEPSTLAGLLVLVAGAILFSRRRIPYVLFR
ncbi:MAG: PEP-CTERM sorting domain-containing protein [Pirellulales bacterium]|nr:PEP-CTERM sorting domain-containing protein [Pirellulales bacterium]